MWLGWGECLLSIRKPWVPSPVLHRVEAHARLESQLLESGGPRMRVSKLSLATE